MSGLEESVIPIATPLILGRPSLLTIFDQWLLASFLCLISMRVALLGGKPEVVPQEERDWLRLHGSPPLNWQIWIMRVAGDNLTDHWTLFSAIARAKPDSPPPLKNGVHPYNTQVTTIVLGQLCAHLFSSRAWPGFAGYENIDMTQTWPPAHFDIDPRWVPTVTHDVATALHRTHEREAEERASRRA